MLWFIERLRKFTEKQAIIEAEVVYTYSQLADRIDTYKRQIDREMDDGDVVALLSDYSFQSIALFIALAAKGCVLVPMAGSVADEVEERLRESCTDWIVRLKKDELSIRKHEGPEKHGMIKSLQDEEHSGLILFSSGSTGKPKAMIHDLDNLLEMYRGRKPKSVSFIVLLMFDHIGGLNTLLNSLSMGAKIVIPGTRDPDEVCRLIEKHQVRILPASPTFLNLVLMSGSAQKYDLSSLRMITYGTEPMPESLLKRLRVVFPKTRFLQTFGTSETGIAQTSSRSSSSLDMRLRGSQQEYKIVNGELWLRSKSQILGYLNADMDNFFEDGWFKTGDLVEEKGDGYFRIIGRRKEIINVGGEKVLPIEVESVLMEMAEIDDCVAYGEQNAITGQTVIAKVVLRDGADAGSIKKVVRRYCRGRLAAYKVPTKVDVVERMDFGDRHKKMRPIR